MSARLQPNKQRPETNVEPAQAVLARCAAHALSVLALLVFGAGIAGLSGCGKEPPTSTAPPTLKNINVEEINKKNAQEDEDFNDDLDDDLDDDDLDDDDGSGPIINPRFSRSGPGGDKGARKAGGPGAKKGGPSHSQEFAPTINGHPKGPKADVFNAVINSSFPRVNRCFAAQMSKMGPGRKSMKVRIVVSNSGSVKAAKVVSGMNNGAVRSCILNTMKSLKFPSYEGSEVKQVVPFAFMSR